ncbi:MAG: hypothetical protein AAF570_05635, partial [Bacteroidota bacterium]
STPISEQKADIAEGIPSDSYSPSANWLTNKLSSEGPGAFGGALPNPGPGGEAFYKDLQSNLQTPSESMTTQLQALFSADSDLNFADMLRLAADEVGLAMLDGFQSAVKNAEDYLVSSAANVQSFLDMPYDHAFLNQIWKTAHEKAHRPVPTASITMLETGAMMAAIPATVAMQVYEWSGVQLKQRAYQPGLRPTDLLGKEFMEALRAGNAPRLLSGLPGKTGLAMNPKLAKGWRVLAGLGETFLTLVNAAMAAVGDFLLDPASAMVIGFLREAVLAVRWLFGLARQPYEGLSESETWLKDMGLAFRLINMLLISVLAITGFSGYIAMVARTVEGFLTMAFSVITAYGAGDLRNLVSLSSVHHYSGAVLPTTALLRPLLVVSLVATAGADFEIAVPIYAAIYGLGPGVEALTMVALSIEIIFE